MAVGEGRKPFGVDRKRYETSQISPKKANFTKKHVFFFPAREMHNIFNHLLTALYIRYKIVYNAIIVIYISEISLKC